MKSIDFLKKYGTDPKNLKAWFSPSAGPRKYPLCDFNNKSLREVAKEQLNNCGVNNIMHNDTDTTTSQEYYSHSQGDHDKRHAILVYIK